MATLRNVQVMYSDHEEADTRMILHAKNTGHNHENIVIQSPDTDVAVLSIFAFFSLQCREVWFQTGTKDKFQYIPIHTISQELGPDVCSALPGFHFITGCDSTSALCGIGKKKGFQLLKSSAAYQQSLQGLGNSLEVSEACRAFCEKFVCSLYSPTAFATVDEAKYTLFCQKQKQNENLPTTSNSLGHHIEQSNFQAYIWKNCLTQMQNLPSPNGLGSLIQEGTFVPLLMSREPAPVALLELTASKCKKSACRRSDICQCEAVSLVCTEACLCMAGEYCENVQNTDYINDSDGDD